MDDGSGVLLPYMTQMRTFMRANAEAGVEAVAQLTQYGYHFSQQLNARMLGVDLSLPENQPFKIAAKALQDEFADYMNKIHFSNPSALAALASQVSQFDQKLAELPQTMKQGRRRRTAYPERGVKVAEKAQEAVPPPPLDGGPRPQIAAY